MSNDEIIRAWKDEEYCKNLSKQMRSQLPENPAGIVELTQTEMETIAGGYRYPGSWVDRCPSTLGCQISNNPVLCPFE
jgi:mersacidin/lichenicidin family type 2 lantibiotic